MNFFQRFMTAVLGLLLLIGVFAACSSSSDDGKGDDSTQAETQPPNAENVYELLGIPEGNRDYDGATYKIAYTQRLFGDNESEVGYTFEELDGGVLSQAVWNRNQKVNSLLNVKIEAHYCPWDAMADECTRAVLADDGRFELICTRIEQQTLLAEAGYLKNILNVDTIDTTAAWWNQQGVERFTFFDDLLYFIYGDINYYDDYGITAMVFNKDSFEDNNWEFPYEDVRNGEWTFEKMLTYIQGASKDLNPTGVWDENDYYGLTTNAGFIINFLMGFGDDLATMSADGSTFELAPFNSTTAQRVVSRAYKIFDALATSPDVVNADRDYGYEITDAIFSDGRALFNTTLLGAIGDLPKHSNVNYGILPLPKYDEEQASYYAPLTTSWATAYSIFVKCSDIDLAGYIMSAMSYYGQDTITEAVVDKIFYYRAAQDPDDTEMVRLLMNNKFLPLNGPFRLTWGENIHAIMCGMTVNGLFTMASDFAAHRSVLEGKIAATVAAFQQYKNQ